jgi:dTDP-4-dehydrorhamnose 3,5-epimerase
MFKFTKLDIGLVTIETESFPDERGIFSELYKGSEFKKNGVEDDFVQENLSYSKKGVLRGLHYQSEPEAQGKLINVVSGKIFDVAVDIRKGSPTFGKWYGLELSGKNNKMLWIPKGFAHGFLALEDSYVAYKTTKEYSKSHENGILWSDPDIGIEWPSKNPIVNARDNGFGGLKNTNTGFVYKK